MPRKGISWTIRNISDSTLNLTNFDIGNELNNPITIKCDTSGFITQFRYLKHISPIFHNPVTLRQQNRRIEFELSQTVTYNSRVLITLINQNKP